MSASRGPGEERTSYDRWTFERWSEQYARHQRQALRRRATLALCIAAVFVVVSGVAWKLRQARTTLLTPPMVTDSGALAGVTVILDPGHGGEDSGANQRWGNLRVQEASLTYRTAMELSRVLRARGAQVRYTVRSQMLSDDRDRLEPLPTLPTDAVMVATDRPLKSRAGHSPQQLWQRAEIARRVWDASVRRDPRAARDVFFLSLHYDLDRDQRVHGGVVCTDRRLGHPPLFALALARLLAAHGWGRPTVSEGQASLSDRSLGVLNPLYNPVPQKALLEVTTISNYDDCLAATDPAWREQVALAVAQAITVVHQSR